MRWTTAAGCAAAIVLSGCASTPGPSAEAVRLDRGVEARAAAFDAYARSAGALDANFTSTKDVAHALDVAAAYEPRSLEGGMIAFAGAAALQDPAFAAGVRKAARAQPGLARRLAANPDAALQLPGGRAAAARASAALMRQAAPLEHAGAAATKASYAMQKQAWARAAAPDPRGRLARVKAAGAHAPAGSDPAALYASAGRGGGRGSTSPVAVRGVAVAALSVLGEGGRAKALLSEPRSGQCLRLAKLNLHQCLASAGPNYEDVYCLGRHALSETAQCVETAAKGPMRRAAG
ncbi:hypothetical protein [Phenylobacterium sp.]|uniref:hypothetical protein n=1 Tax=Phenylobacterium sp. TaxID=1871053 RepID=UPI0035B3B775